MANEFKAAAERKKRITQVRKAETLIGQIEELLTGKADVMADEDKQALQASADKLKELIENNDANSEAIGAGREEAEAVFQAVSEKLSGQQEENAPAAEEEPSSPAEEEKTNEAPAEAETVEEVPTKEEVPEQEEAPAEEDQENEKISSVLRRMYNAPRHIDRETKTRFSALIKPSLRKKMDEDAKEGRIKSPNDLINVLLEIYYGEN